MPPELINAARPAPLATLSPLLRRQLRRFAPWSWRFASPCRSFRWSASPFTATSIPTSSSSPSSASTWPGSRRTSSGTIRRRTASSPCFRSPPVCSPASHSLPSIPGCDSPRWTRSPGTRSHSSSCSSAPLSRSANPARARVPPWVSHLPGPLSGHRQRRHRSLPATSLGRRRRTALRPCRHPVAAARR